MPAGDQTRESLARYARLNEAERGELVGTKCIVTIDLTEMCHLVLNQMVHRAEKMRAPIKKSVAEITLELLDGVIQRLDETIQMAGNPLAIYLVVGGRSGTFEDRLRYQKVVITNALDLAREKIEVDLKCKVPNPSHRLNRMDLRAQIAPKTHLILALEDRLEQFVRENPKWSIQISKSAEPGESNRKMISWIQNYSDDFSLRRVLVTPQVRMISDALATSLPGMVIYGWNRMMNRYDQFSVDKYSRQMSIDLPKGLCFWKSWVDLDLACLARLLGSDLSPAFGFTLGQLRKAYSVVIARVNHRSTVMRNLVQTTVSDSLSLVVYPDWQIVAEILRECDLEEKRDSRAETLARECLDHLVGKENATGILQQFHHGTLHYHHVAPLITEATQLCKHYQRLWKALVFACQNYHAFPSEKQRFLEEQMQSFHWDRLTGDLFYLMRAHETIPGLTTLSSLFPALEAYYYQVQTTKPVSRRAAPGKSTIPPPTLPFFVTGVDRRTMLGYEEKVFQTYHLQSRIQAPLRNAIFTESPRANLVSEAISRYVLDCTRLLAHPSHPINVPDQFGLSPQSPPLQQFCDVLDKITLAHSREIAIDLVRGSRIPQSPYLPPVNRHTAAKIVSKDLVRRLRDPKNRVTTLLCPIHRNAKTMEHLVLNLDRVAKLTRIQREG